jgi:cGMP-dependent protein kinase 1
LSQGNGFGELALLYGSARTASIVCKGTCAFWAIDRKTFRNTVEEIVRREFDENRKFIEQTKFFSNFLNYKF